MPRLPTSAIPRPLARKAVIAAAITRGRFAKWTTAAPITENARKGVWAPLKSRKAAKITAIRHAAARHRAAGSRRRFLEPDLTIYRSDASRCHFIPQADSASFLVGQFVLFFVQLNCWHLPCQLSLDHGLVSLC